MRSYRLPGRLAAVWVAALLFGAVGRAQETAFIRWVDDGDTVVLADGRRVRYIGIDAPEVAHEGKKSERLGPEAGAANRRMVLHTRVRLEPDAERSDQYGRLLAYVFGSENLFVNRAMLLMGYAVYLYRAPNLRYHDSLLAAQRTAMQAGRGIWAGWCKKKESFTGNKSSRRFHLEDCPLAAKIAAPNRIRFSGKWEAYWEGYAPAKDCLPGGASE